MDAAGVEMEMAGKGRVAVDWAVGCGCVAVLVAAVLLAAITLGNLPYICVI